MQISCGDNYHQIYCELDAAAYIIGISVKSWVGQCLCRVDGGCMGLRMLWFAFGFVLSDALFQDFFTVPACLPQISIVSGDGLRSPSPECDGLRSPSQKASKITREEPFFKSVLVCKRDLTVAISRDPVYELQKGLL